jgi:tRNA A-37 threonylcarbamoyl transferase component Bud32
MKRRAEPSDAPSPTVIAGFTELERIGSGGFSVVFRAHEAAMSRDVAIKVLNSGLDTEAERRVFERECRALGQLTSHPNIVTVYHAAFTTDMRPCIVMELYHGNFRERLDRGGPLAPDELLSVGVRIAGALHTAHTAGVLHRDLKPHNIFLSAYGEPALGDFGISTIDDERSHSGASGLSVAYAAPEVLEDGAASVASDVYSLAATLYHLAAGAAPFASGDLRTSVRRILTEAPPALPRSDLPAGLDRALRACMAKEPSERPASALALAEMLREVQHRAGLLPTTIPTVGLDAASAPTASPAAGAPPLLPPPALAGGGSGSVSVARRSRPGPDLPATAPAVSTRRRWIAAGAVLAAVAALVAGIALLGGGDGASVATTTVPASAAPPDTFFATVATPRSVTVTKVADGSFRVDVAPVEGAIGYEIEPVGGAPTVSVDADALPATLEAPGAAALCVVVRAVGDGGRISRDAPPACST